MILCYLSWGSRWPAICFVWWLLLFTIRLSSFRVSYVFILFLCHGFVHHQRCTETPKVKYLYHWLAILHPKSKFFGNSVLIFTFWSFLLSKNSENNNCFLPFSVKTTCFQQNKNIRKDVFFTRNSKNPRKTLGLLKNPRSREKTLGLATLSAILDNQSSILPNNFLNISHNCFNPVRQQMLY